MRFLYPDILWLLLLLPVFALLKGRRGAAPAVVFSTTSVARTLAAGRKVSTGHILLGLKLLVLTCIILALARPEQGNTTTEINASGIDILLAVDVSSSMEAMDFRLKGQSVNRLEVVKNVVGSFIEARPNDRIGLLAFAGKPYLVSPLTLDHNWLQKRLESLSIGMIEDGTAMGSAIGSSVNRLRDQKAKSRIIILLTDGVNNVPTLEPVTAAELAKNLDVRVYTVAIGRNGMVPFPVDDPIFGRRTRQIETKIDLELLTQIADMTGGRMYQASDPEGLQDIFVQIDQLETARYKTRVSTWYRPLMAWFAGPALLLLLLEGLLAITWLRQVP